MMSHLIQTMIKEGQAIEHIAQSLDQLESLERLHTIRSLNAATQKKLWGLCQERSVSLSDLVPMGREKQEVRHFGRNTLPVFKYFEKRFYAPASGVNELWGYNEGPTRPWVGPGYFTARLCRDDEPENFVIDYEQVPHQADVTDWPAVQPNEKGLSRFVYAYMQDYLRKVSQHVIIGRAYRKGKASPNYFTLCRWDEETDPQL